MRFRARHGVALTAVLVTLAISAWWIWGNHAGTDTQRGAASTISGGDTGVLALTLTVVAAVLAWLRQAGAAERRQRDAVAGTAGALDGRWPVLGEIVDLERLGVRVPRESSRARRPQLPYAGRHLLDGQLREALTLHRFVLVHGPSAAGKSRSAVQAALGLYSGRLVVVPELRPGHLDDLLKEGAVPEQALIWLDDLDRHLDREGGALTSGVIQRLLAVDGVKIVATMRATAFEQYKPHGDIRPSGRDVIDLTEQVDFTGWDATDRAAATEQLAGYADVVAALTKQMGLGEYLAAGPELIERLESGAPPAEGTALVRAAGDWYRAGMTRPVPDDLLRQLYPHYLPEDDRRLLDRYDQGLRWACESVSGARLIIDLTDGSGLSVHDYVLDYLSAQPVGLPKRTWDILATRLAESPDDLSSLGSTAFATHHDSTTAERLFRAAAEQGQVSAMNNLGVLLKVRGEIEEAERWWRPAAAAGAIMAMSNLGVLLMERGDLDEAEPWCRSAAAAGASMAMINLGGLLVLRGRLDEAEHWYRAAVVAGARMAMINLGALFEDRGELEEAERWYREVASGGNSDGMNSLGILLEKRGDLEEAERWYRKAAGDGSTGAMNNLGVLLMERAELDEAERWYREAIAAGNDTAAINLGNLLKERGDIAGAEVWWRKAADGGDVVAMYDLGVLLKERGDRAGAEVWWRKAADGGDVGAMFNLGLQLMERGETVEGERWYRDAAAGGDADAMFNLGNSLVERGEMEEAERWFRDAAVAGNIHGMNNLGNLLKLRGKRDDAEHWFREAIAAGNARGMNNLGVMLMEQGQFEEAERWYREAIAAGNETATRNLARLPKSTG